MKILRNFLNKLCRFFSFRKILIRVFFFSLQITIIERQVFDFLGYMWAPIFVNFFHMLFIIFGFYGAYHFKVKYIITVSIKVQKWIMVTFENITISALNSMSLRISLGQFICLMCNRIFCLPFFFYQTQNN